MMLLFEVKKVLSKPLMKLLFLIFQQGSCPHNRKFFDDTGCEIY